MRFPEIEFRLPDWVEAFLLGPGQIYESVEDRMRFTIELSRLNVEYKTGGPFGAGIFDLETKKLLCPGINLVTQTNSSIAHAEIMAMMIAHQMLGSYDLGAEGMPPLELVISSEPCAMCIGAISWSGIQKIIYGAREEDVRSIGFDEGPKPADWIKALENRGITVIKDVCRDEALAVLHHYHETGGIIYNGRQCKS